MKRIGRAVLVRNPDGERARPRAAARPAGLSSRTTSELAGTANRSAARL